MYIYIYITNILHRARYYTRDIHYKAVQYKGGVQNMTNTNVPSVNQTVWRTTQDRARPLTHRRPVRVNLYCSAPCTSPQALVFVVGRDQGITQRSSRL